VSDLAESERSFLSSPETRAVLKAVAESGVKTIEPAYTSSSGLTYPLIELKTGLPPRNIIRALEELARVHLLRGEQSELTDILPCGSTKFSHRLRCPTCGDRKMNAVTGIQDRRCGYAGTLDTFTGEKELRCPRCGKKLKRDGYDFIQGTFLVCQSCGRSTTNPALEIICLDHRETYQSTELIPFVVKRYQVTEKATKALKRAATGIDIIAQWLNDSGMRAADLATVRGKSGTRHELALAIWASPTFDKPTPKIAVEVAIPGSTPDMLLSTLAKLLDIPSEVKVLVVIGEDDPKFNETCSYYGIILKYCHDYSELPPTILEVLGDIRIVPPHAKHDVNELMRGLVKELGESR